MIRHIPIILAIWAIGFLAAAWSIGGALEQAEMDRADMLLARGCVQLAQNAPKFCVPQMEAKR